ncbi:hypothetical protein FG386_001373 [Cryptosporidium ryanae]|uniref:uncharacterized protein n=1 Tax=Cryptosporidium ryanae TaxID=515981 RepID=UPI00351A577C|nr:hypothetical protein FG386_001373 [Cryptosporidium ryanae]
MCLFVILSLVLLKFILTGGSSIDYDGSFGIAGNLDNDFDNSFESSGLNYIRELDLSVGMKNEESYSLINNQNRYELDSTLLYNPYIYESYFEGIDVKCGEDYCRNGLYKKRSKKLYKRYMLNVVKEYILNSKVHSWFYRIWSGSTVLSSPVLYVEKSTEFKDLYKSIRTSYKKLKDSSVIIVLKVHTKELTKKKKLLDEDSYSENETNRDGMENSDSESSSVKLSEFEESKVGEKIENDEVETPVNIAISSLCIKLITLTRSRNRDNGKSYMFVIDSFGITSRQLFVNLMINIMNTPCWNRANINKSRIVIPVIIGNFRRAHNKKNEDNGILDDIYMLKRREKNEEGVEINRSESEREDESPSMDSTEASVIRRLSSSYDKIRNQLFIKWLKACNESKLVYDRYEMRKEGLFKKLLLQYLIYAINNQIIFKNLSSEGNHFLIEYPLKCQESWDSLIYLLESEYGDDTNTSEDYVIQKNMAINSVVDALFIANNSMFKDKHLTEEVDEENVVGDVIENKSEPELRIVSDSKNKLKRELESCELLNILTNREQLPVELKKARILDDLLLGLINLPDQRKQRIEYKKFLKKTIADNSDIDYLSNDLFQLFEAVDHVQNSIHVIRALFISNIELGLTLNPLELLVNVCRNAKLIPYSQQKDNYLRNEKESENGQDYSNNDYRDKNDDYNALNSDEHENINSEDNLEDECNPFLFISQDILSDEYNADLMEPIQKSSLKFVLFLLRLSQYSLQALNLHVSNLVVKTERLLLSNILETKRIPTMVLVLSEKIKYMPFTVLSSYSYIKELKETRISSLLNPIVPIFHSYTLINLFGDSITPTNNYEISKIVLMEICLIYFNPNLFLDKEFVKLCNLTWNYKSKQEYYIQIDVSTRVCDKVTSDRRNIGRNSHTVFLICNYLENLRGKFSSNKKQSEIEQEYVSSEFNNRCENIKAYCIQQSGDLFRNICEIQHSK